MKDRKVEKQKELYSNFITLYLFDDKTLSEKEIEDFRRINIKTALDRKVAIKVLLVFEENFKGETNEMIKNLFFQWDLCKMVENDLKSEKWFKIARAIFVASELNLKRFGTVIEKYLDAERDEVRQQAILYFIQSASSQPLDFLNKIKKPLTLWEQIYIEECLKSNYSGEIPDFSECLQNKLSSVKTFSIKMIGEYNQYENIPKLSPFLDSQNPDLKIETINSLCKLGYPELIQHLERTFVSEIPKVKSFILATILKIGSIDDFLRFEKMIPKDDWVNKQVYFKLKHSLNKELELSVA